MNKTEHAICEFENYLRSEEKAEATVEKYIRDVTAFCIWADGKEPTKDLVLAYKAHITGHYAPQSVNSMLSSINCFFAFWGRHDLKVKTLKIQRQLFLGQEKELTRAEYARLLRAADTGRNPDFSLLLQTLGATGIRISELRHVSAEAVRMGKAIIHCKGKMRIVLFPKKLCKMLQGYATKRKIKSGPLFVTRNGKPLDRSNIWKIMKLLAEKAGVPKEKVFPHNLRHLFARCYYQLEKDIVRLSDILGHASVNTTRIYTMESGEVHKRQIEKLGLLRC